MLTAGILGGIFGPIQELWYTEDYWHPEYIGPWPWIEDIIFGFAIAGIAAAIYEIVLARWVREQYAEKPHPLLTASLFLIAGFGSGIFFPIMNSIYSAMAAFIIVWLVIMALRRDLFFPALASGTFLMLLAFIGYQLVFVRSPGVVQSWWDLDRISGVLLLGIPLEEYLWFFFMGLALGPLYEFFRGIRFTKNLSPAI